MSTKPTCPACGSPKAIPFGPRTYRCGNCDGLYDDDPSEGADYSDRNPAARIERAEREAQKRKERHANHRR